MKKRLRGKTCVYCCESPATTDDHIFAVGFFHRADQDGKALPKVPACERCNNEKSKLDEYAMTVLAFGGRHPSSAVNLLENGGKRLVKNHALRNRIREGTGRAMVKEGPAGIIQPTITVAIDAPKLVSLYKYIARGLVWEHRKVVLAPSTTIDVLFQTQQQAEEFKQNFAGWRWKKVQVRLRNQTVQYEGIFADEDPAFSAWRVAIYGGVNFAWGDPQAGVCNVVGIMTNKANAHVVPT